MALSSLGHRFGTQLISTVFIVHFVADKRRVEDTGHGHFAETTQQVLVVLIQNVQRAGFDRVNLAVGHGFNFTFAADAVHRLEVVLIPDGRFGIGVNGGDVEGETHVVVFQQHAHAVPGAGFAFNFTGRVLTFFQSTDDHNNSCKYSMRSKWGGGGGSAPAQTADQEALEICSAITSPMHWARMSRPAFRVCSSMVSGVRIFTTWP